ncbi:MAG: DUF4339 domain-containing protein [Deltaproteobacteria bacterium]|nr:MAG: DUF4339 domain-containing protein [Deltaproteobacteria bacterium]TNF30059.1 MAG: DUF4339 domain-containing protein [Deltaproteobacteria bacterium]
MAESWYYVDGSERVGPVAKSEIEGLFEVGKLNSESYVWTKGYDNWKKIAEVDEFSSLGSGSEDEDTDDDIIAPVEMKVERAEVERSNENFDFTSIDPDEKRITIKIGLDRGGSEAEYGPFSLNQLKQAFKEKRINAKTLIYTSGMKDWTFLADLPLYQELFEEMPPVIGETERRSNTRKPFIARMFFHDQNDVFEGVCRDISVGGLQILVSGFPGNVGDTVNLNVHPDNSDYCFVASGKVVRLLDGGQGFSLRFTDISDEAKKSISEYIDHS